MSDLSIRTKIYKFSCFPNPMIAGDVCVFLTACVTMFGIHERSWRYLPGDYPSWRYPPPGDYPSPTR